MPMDNAKILLGLFGFWSGYNVVMAREGGFDMIDTFYQFGDSVSDTGNWKRENPDATCATFPYGETYFHYATGRCCDGLLMVDFYAMAFGLGFLPPYLEKDANFRDGVNFAVVSATTLDLSFFVSMGYSVSGYTSSSLSVQLGWFREYLESTCAECKSKLSTSLILMEDIGCNDYIVVLKNGGSFQAVYDLVPRVIEEIVDVVQELIIMGAEHVVIPSSFPMGCMPHVITSYKWPHPDMFDDLGCLRDFNRLSEYHNARLQEAIQDLQSTNPWANLIYADYYSAVKALMRNASSLGFEAEAVLVTCCGQGDNPYNFNESRLCGTLEATVCPHPETRVQWDGYHFTQHFYMYLSNWMLQRTILPQLSPALSS